MNYYEHHLGDYVRDTAHLSMLEDGAYRRLMDAYYIREQPLPPALKDCCRLARAQSKPERDAVDAVLKEFFHQSPEGWRHKRCDEEIARYLDKQAKARRSAQARWGSQPVAQQALSDDEGNANASMHAMRPHGEGNASQSPDASSHIPANQSVSYESAALAQDEKPAEMLEISETPIKERNVRIAILLRELKVKPFTAMHPLAIEWAGNPKVTDDILKAAVESARQYKPDDQHISPNYLKPIVGQLIAPQQSGKTQHTSPQKQWFESNAGIYRKALELGVEPTANESFNSLRKRVEDEIRRREGSA